MFYNKLILESQYASCGVLAPGYYVMLQHNLENSITNISVFPFPTFIHFLSSSVFEGSSVPMLVHVEV